MHETCDLYTYVIILLLSSVIRGGFMYYRLGRLHNSIITKLVTINLEKSLSQSLSPICGKRGGVKSIVNIENRLSKRRKRLGPKIADRLSFKLGDLQYHNYVNEPSITTVYTSRNVQFARIQGPLRICNTCNTKKD